MTAAHHFVDININMFAAPLVHDKGRNFSKRKKSQGKLIFNSIPNILKLYNLQMKKQTNPKPNKKHLQNPLNDDWPIIQLINHLKENSYADFFAEQRKSQSSNSSLIVN